jgi:geranylgeranyl diphosphate synthase type II
MSGRGAISSSLASVPSERERLGELRAEVDLALHDLLPSPGADSNRLHEAMRQAVLSPGKRIRPILALLSAEHLGCPTSRAMPAACALEMVHAASLVLDDLPCMDDSGLRRGEPSIHVRHGEDIAVLASIALLSQAFAILARAPHISDAARLRTVAILARTIGANGLVDGQVKDLRAVADPSVTALREVHHQKTGVLFIASVEIGAVVAEASPTAVTALRCFAEELGLAYQALDDLDDGEEVQSGKPGASMLSVLGKSALRQEAAARIEGAKAALRQGDPRLRGMQAHVDLLLNRPEMGFGLD